MGDGVHPWFSDVIVVVVWFGTAVTVKYRRCLVVLDDVDV